MALEKATDNSERDKAAGNTPAQQEVRAYHESDFQTHDPVTGEKRSNPLPELVNDAIVDPFAEEAQTDVEATDAARDLAREEGIDLSTVKATGASGQITVGDVRDAIAKRDA
jgi:pyruvate/2-oxoglutarate dehydrogenase complex dihydrolipoamide acyltransferase (E2) component